MIHRDGWLQIKTRIDNKGFTAQIKQVESELQTLKKRYEETKNLKPFKGQEEDLKTLEVEIEKTNNKLATLRKKQLEIDSEGLSNIKSGAKDINSSISKTIKKVGKLALAVFGVRSAYMAVRSAASILAQYNEQIGTDLEYIKFALATALQPIVEKLISLVYTLLGYINMITKSLFNVDLFANAGANAFKKANKGAKELKKTLLGFDEINQLQDNNNESSSGGVAPSVDLSNMKEPDLSKIYSWTDKVKEIVGTAFGKIKENVKKVMTDFGFSDEFILGWEIMVDGAKLAFDGLLDAIGGILEIIIGLVTGDTEKVKEGISKLVKGIGEMLWGLLKTLIGIFGMMVASLYDLIIKPFIEGVKVLIKKIGELFKGLWDGIKSGFSSAINFIKNIFNSVVSFFKNIISTIVGLFKSIGTKVGDVIGGAFKAVINGILSAIENILNFPIKTINKLIGVINKIPGINIGKLSTFNLPRLASGGIVDIPKTGLNIGNAIVGEAGAEGVLPLTNPETMSRLGKEIGKWVSIDITNYLTMNGRVLMKELKTLDAETSFARNGG